MVPELPLLSTSARGKQVDVEQARNRWLSLVAFFRTSCTIIDGKATEDMVGDAQSGKSIKDLCIEKEVVKRLCDARRLKLCIEPKLSPTPPHARYLLKGH